MKKNGYVSAIMNVLMALVLLFLAAACTANAIRCGSDCIATIRFTIPACAYSAKLSPFQYITEVGFLTHLASMPVSAQRYLAMHGFEGVICLVLAGAAAVIAVRTIVKFRRREEEQPDIGNEMAAAAVAALTDRDGKSSYNPLYLYGTAEGKATLLKVIEEKMRTLHISWEALQEILPETVSSGRSIENLSKCEIVIIDGLDSLISFPEQQTSLVNVIQRIYEDGKAIVLVSDCNPNHLQSLKNSLIGRFETFFMIDVKSI